MLDYSRTDAVVERLVKAAAELPIRPSPLHRGRPTTVQGVVDKQVATTGEAWGIIQALNRLHPETGFDFTAREGAPLISESNLMDYLLGFIALYIEEMAATTVLRHPAAWMLYLYPGYEIREPDGWRDKPLGEKINRREFEQRASRSTLGDISQRQAS